MAEAITKKEPQTLAGDLERVLIMGDLAMLKPEERLSYYKAVCESVGLNPLTKPLDYITLNGKLTLYANRSCTEQLRKLHQVSILPLEDKIVSDVYIVTAQAQDKTGRTDCSRGAVNIGGLKGDNLANALMKAETKAKRRVTLSICGLGLLDESELETVPEDVPVAPEPNLNVQCSQCGQLNSHATDCPTKQPKPAAAPKQAKPKAEPEPKQEPKPQAEGKVIEPDNKNLKGWLFVDNVIDKVTAKKAAYQVWQTTARTGEKHSINVFHKTLHKNSGFVKGNWAECEVSSKPSSSDPSKTLYSLEKVTASEDANGITRWVDNSPVETDPNEGGMPLDFDGDMTP